MTAADTGPAGADHPPTADLPLGTDHPPAVAAAAAGPVDVTLLGSRFSVHGCDTELAATLHRLLAPFRTGAAAPAGPARIVRAPAGVPAGPAAQQVLGELNTAALATADCFAVHAGVVAAGERAVAFPGPSGAGKSTLTAACLLAGLAYVSDEALCVRWDGTGLVPYPRPIALSRWSRAAALGRQSSTVESASTDEELLTPADLAAQVATGPITLAHVVLLHRPDPAAPSAAPALVPIPRQEAVTELLRRSFTHYRRPRRAFVLAHELAAAARTWRLTLGDPSTAARLIAALLRPG